MAGERQWVETVKRDVEAKLTRRGIFVYTGLRVPYVLQASAYQGLSDGALSQPNLETRPYQTDLLLVQKLADAWVPRVVVEFKFGRVSSHDALTYSAKAATHKNVHPYLRYGFVVGNFKGSVPNRLLWHGDHFDFMMTIGSKILSPARRKSLVDLLDQEMKASQTISDLLSERKQGAWLVHRRLEVRSN